MNECFIRALDLVTIIFCFVLFQVYNFGRVGKLSLHMSMNHLYSGQSNASLIMSKDGTTVKQRHLGLVAVLATLIVATSELENKDYQ